MVTEEQRKQIEEAVDIMKEGLIAFADGIKTITDGFRETAEAINNDPRYQDFLDQKKKEIGDALGVREMSDGTYTKLIEHIPEDNGESEE